MNILIRPTASKFDPSECWSKSFSSSICLFYYSETVSKSVNKERGVGWGGRWATWKHLQTDGCSCRHKWKLWFSGPTVFLPWYFLYFSLALHYFFLLLFSVFLLGFAVFLPLLFSVFLSGLASKQSNLSHNWAIHCTYNMNGYDHGDFLTLFLFFYLIFFAWSILSMNVILILIKWMLSKHQKGCFLFF